MKLRTLGKTGIQVSEIGIGAWQLGGPLVLDGVNDGHPDLGGEFVTRLIHDCGELGINFIDTAEQYGNGESERRVGNAIKGRRDQWIVSTKFGYQVGPNGERRVDASAKRVPISLEGSLRRLQTDYLDIYLYHCAPDPDEAAAVAEFLAAAKQKGQARAIGISTASATVCESLLALGCLDVVQFPKNIMEPAEEITALLERRGVGGIVRGAFYGGRLSGRYFHQAPHFPAEDIRSKWAHGKAADDFTKFARFEELVTPQRSMVQVALRHLLDQPTTTTIIPGAKSLESYQEAVRATETAPLTGNELARIEAIRRELAGI
jgi:aryl-alcohol dehydrogenase-like predicted oxidoreductase